MAIIVITTPGSATANSYSTVAEGTAYHTGRLHNDDWSDAGGSEKSAAVVWATRLLDDHIVWDGVRSDGTQVLEWPRYGLYDPGGYAIDSGIIPQFLKEAAAELARWLIAEDRTLETNRDLVGFKEIKIGTLKLKTESNKSRPVIPPSVLSMINHYGHIKGRKKTLVRI